MAKLELADGRRIPMVEPTLWDGVEVERETGWDRKKYAAMMALTSVQTGFAIFASLRRAGIETTFDACMNMAGVARIVAQPGDLARAEGEQSEDPQRAEGSATLELVAEPAE